MKRLLKIPLAGAVIAIARALIRRLLSDGGEKASDPGDGRPPSSLTREQLYREAARLDIPGRSKMNKRQLQQAVEDARIGGSP
jgi:hypothetical protein